MDNLFDVLSRPPIVRRIRRPSPSPGFSMEYLFHVLWRFILWIWRPRHPSAADPSPEEQKKKIILPPDDVTTVILASLPPKSLHKFRSVCKSWNYLITRDTYFGSTHHLQTQSNLSKKPPPRIVTLTSTRARKDRRLEYKLGYTSGSTCIDFSPAPDKHYHMTNSCNGLVCVFAQNVIYLANPSIAKLQELPIGTPHTGVMPSVAIAFDSENKEYKVIRLFNRHPRSKQPQLASTGCEVLSLRGGAISTSSWRAVDDPPIIKFDLMIAYGHVPLVVDGSVYWQLCGETCDRPVALSFIISQEKFALIYIPQGIPSTTRCNIFDLRGCVALAESRNDQLIMAIWSLKDPHNSVWQSLYTIDFSVTSRAPIYALPMTNSHHSNDRRIVIYWIDEGEKMYYDPDVKSFVGREIHRGVDCQRHAAYTESIVWPCL